jgi:hypothetical protein
MRMQSAVVKKMCQVLISWKRRTRWETRMDYKACLGRKEYRKLASFCLALLSWEAALIPHVTFKPPREGTTQMKLGIRNDEHHLMLGSNSHKQLQP